MTATEQVIQTLTPALVERAVREIAAERGEDQAGIAVEVIAQRILDQAQAANMPRERAAALEALIPRIAKQVAAIDGMRFIHND